MIQAILRPRHNDVMLIDDDGEHFLVSVADALQLADALRTAVAIPAHAATLTQPKETQQ